MQRDSGIAISTLRVDGGMVPNALLMQFQADILNVPVLRPRTIETTALGAAYAAGLAVGYWQNTDDLVRNWGVTHTWSPRMRDDQRATLTAAWHKAVERTFNWA
jgi:glycerol kinase